MTIQEFFAACDDIVKIVYDYDCDCEVVFVTEDNRQDILQSDGDIIIKKISTDFDGLITIYTDPMQ